MIFGVFSNPNKDNGLIETAKLISAIKKLKADVIVCDVIKTSFPSEKSLPRAELCKNSDVLFTLGGDGTILKIARYCATYSTPVIGINLGKLGFLTEIEAKDYESVISQIIDGDFRIDERIMLKTTTCKGVYYSLNDVNVSRAKNLKMVPTDVYIDDNFYYCYYSDGVLVASPTGSTGYSLSAGGPVLSPSIDGFVINSICPHSLHNKPVVISSKQVVTLVTKGNNKAVLLSDGDEVEELEPNSRIKVEIAEYKIKFIRLKNTNFYDRLIKKLNHWSNIEGKL